MTPARVARPVRLHAFRLAALAALVLAAVSAPGRGAAALQSMAPAAAPAPGQPDGTAGGVRPPAGEAAPGAPEVSSWAPSPAAAKAPAPDPALQAVADLSQATDALRTQAAQAGTDASLAQVRETAAAAQARAEALAAERAQVLSQVDRRLDALSTPKGGRKTGLSAGEREERARLTARRRLLAEQADAARRSAAAASDVYTQVSNRRRTAFDAHVFERTASPLEAGFWSGLASSLQADVGRLRTLTDGVVVQAGRAEEPRAALILAAGVVLAVLLVGPARRGLLGLLRRRKVRSERPEAFRRTSHALAVVLVDTALPGLAAAALRLGLDWAGLLSDRADELAVAGVTAAVWGAAVLALARQLIRLRREPGSETPAGPDRLNTLPALVASITAAGFLLSRLNSVVGASLAATIAANCVISLAYAAVAGVVLLALSGDARDEEDTAGEPSAARGSSRALASIVLGAAVLVTVGAVFAGYTTFAAMVSSQLFWISVLGASTWLLLRFTDELLTWLFRPAGWVGALLTRVLNLRGRTAEQAGALTSVAVQAVVCLAALSLALTPFGRNGDLLTAHVLHLGGSFHVGSLSVSPTAVAGGLGIFIVGLGFAHLAQGWVDRRFLPLTDWDAGVRNSVSTGVRYLAIGVALLWALAAAGLGFRQIALVASALSVGIGFGLQQIVQNFVSGLILLVERPVKVGDWVNVGGVEGDVQRIRVRATEIRTFDRAILIVPNSDLITKQVQNKTAGAPESRLTLTLTINAAADAPRAREVILGVLRSSHDLLEEPAPNVFVDSVTAGGAVTLNGFAYVASPRDAYPVRSGLYLAVIQALGEAGIVLAGAAGQAVTLTPDPALTDLLRGLRGPAPPAQDPAER